jgi:hypothetical protein
MKSQTGWDLEAVRIECCETESAMRTAQVMVPVGGLGWMHVDWVHSSGALLVCALYAHLCCENAVDSRGMGG